MASSHAFATEVNCPEVVVITTIDPMHAADVLTAAQLFKTIAAGFGVCLIFTICAGASEMIQKWRENNDE